MDQVQAVGRFSFSTRRVLTDGILGQITDGLTGVTAPNSAGLMRTKPKLLFFQWDHRPQSRYAKYLLLHTQDQVRCLAQFFDVVVVNEDCDYDAMCDYHAPDMTLFEVGYQSLLSHRIDIRNTSTHPHIPKAGLFNADSWARTRAGAMSDLDSWGIGVGFSICTTIHDYMPDALDQLFTWPNFIDPEVFRDYGQEKSTTVMLTGSQIELYPWRRRVFPLLAKSYSTLITPIHNYVDASAARALIGESYARSLNASLFAPACGTMAGEIVRKHFEIAGAGCCLITEGTPMAKAAGFRHLENCVFADSDDVLEILDALIMDPDQIRKITDTGHDLVHARHTMANRSQIYQWFLLERDPTSGRITQQGPFGDVMAINPESAHVPIQSAGSLDRALLAEGYDNLLRGDVQQARATFHNCIRLVAEAPEGQLGLSLCDLACDDPGSAADRLAHLIEISTVIYGAQEPDPVEWAFYIFAIADSGRVHQARRFVDWYPRLSHPALDRVRCLLFASHEVAVRRPMRPSIYDRFVHGARGWDKLLPERLDPAQNSEYKSGHSVGQSAGEFLAHALEFSLLHTKLSILKPNIPPIRELNYIGNVARRLRRVVRKSPVGDRLAGIRRYLKDRQERCKVDAS